MTPPATKRAVTTVTVHAPLLPIALTTRRFDVAALCIILSLLEQLAEEDHHATAHQA